MVRGPAGTKTVKSKKKRRAVITGKLRLSDKKPKNATKWRRCKYRKIWVSPHSFVNCGCCRGCPFHG